MKKPKSSRKRYRVYYSNNAPSTKKGKKKEDEGTKLKDKKAGIIVFIVILLIALMGIFRAYQVSTEFSNENQGEQQILDNKKN